MASLFIHLHICMAIDDLLFCEIKYTQQFIPWLYKWFVAVSGNNVFYRYTFSINFNVQVWIKLMKYLTLIIDVTKDLMFSSNLIQSHQ